MKLFNSIIFAIIITSLSSITAFAGIMADVETGAIFTGYNNVQIPGDSGTRFSLKNDIKTDPSIFFRFKLGYTFLENHSVYLFAAPLTLRGKGRIDKTINFNHKIFTEGTEVKSKYRFDSYRLTYLYTFSGIPNFKIGVGLTGKIRSADISLRDDTQEAHRDNVGIVPLIHLQVEWMFADNFSFLVDGDGLAAPQGRAEDFLFAFQYHLKPNFIFRLGYRLLEGGSEGGGDVYTFALFHYIAVGMTFMF